MTRSFAKYIALITINLIVFHCLQSNGQVILSVALLISGLQTL